VDMVMDMDIKQKNQIYKNG